MIISVSVSEGGERDLFPPFTHTDTHNQIILLYMAPLTIVSELMMA
jgi:hypothetical protein